MSMKIKTALDMQGNGIENFLIQGVSAIEGLSDKSLGRKILYTGTNTDRNYREMIYIGNSIGGDGWRTTAYMSDVDELRGLITALENATDEEIEALKGRATTLEGRVDTIDNMLNVENSQTVVDTWEEVKKFLASVSEETDLITLLNGKANAGIENGKGYVALPYANNKQAFIFYNGGFEWSLTNEGWTGTYRILHLGNYSDYALPLTGGTIRNSGAYLLEIDRTDGKPAILFSHNGSPLGYLGYDTEGNPIAHVNSVSNILLHSGNYSDLITTLNGNLSVGGNVGIGVDNPQNALDVNGNVDIKYMLSVGTHVLTPKIKSNTGIDITAYDGDASSSIYLDKGVLRAYSSGKNLIDLGSSTIRWKGIYSGTGDFSGNVTIANDFGVLSKTTDGSVVQMVGITTSNKFYLGTDAAIQNGIPSFLFGKTIDFIVGNSLVERKVAASFDADGNLHVFGNIIADGEVSAGGAGTEGNGGAGGFSLYESWGTSAPTEPLALGANLGYELKTRVEDLELAKTKVTFEPTLVSGKQIGAITIDGNKTNLFAPATYAWSEITGTENVLLKSGGTMSTDAFIAWNKEVNGNDVKDWNIQTYGLRIMSSGGSSTGVPTTYATALHVRGRYGFQLASSGGNYDLFYIRNIAGNGGIREWKTLIHSGNIGEQSVASLIEEQVTDLDDVKIGTFFRSSRNASNLPSGANSYLTGIALATDNNPSYRVMLGIDYSGSIFSRAENAEEWSAWKQIAFTDSNITGNAATATKLQTPRTIWGQSFDGTGDVNGSIRLNTGAEIRIGTGSENYTAMGFSDTLIALGTGSAEKGLDTYISGKNIFLRYGTSKMTAMTITEEGRVLINSSAILDRRLSIGDGGVYVNAILNASPALGSVGSNSLLVGTSAYGMQHWVLGNGQGNIQAGRLDGNATAYSLNLNPLGGAVNVGEGGLNVAGKTILGKTVTFTTGVTYYERAGANYLWANKGGYFVIGVGANAGLQHAALAIYNNEVQPGNRNNAVSLGTSSYRWSDVYSVNGNFSYAVTVGSTILGIKPADGTYNRWKIVSSTGGLYIQSSSYNGQYATGIINMTGYNDNNLTSFNVKSVLSTFSGRVHIGNGADDGTTTLQVNGTSAFYGSTTFGKENLTMQVNFKCPVVAEDRVTIGGATLRWDEEIKALRLNTSLAATGEVSAGGAGTEGGNTGGGGTGTIASPFSRTFTPNEKTSFTFSHDLPYYDVVVQVYEWDISGMCWNMVLADIEIQNNDVTVTLGRKENVEHKIVVR